MSPGYSPKLVGFMQEIPDLDTVSTLLVGMIGTFAVVAGSVTAAKFARRTRVRLASVGKRTQSLLGERMPIIVAAQNKMSDKLILRFTLSDPAVTLFRIELANQLDKTVGIAECLNLHPKSFVAAVEPKVAQHWYNANRYWNGETKQLPMRVFMGDGGHAACHTIWVMMSPGTPLDSGPTDVDNFTWLVDGPC